jgi:phosphatidylethanolamine-binding protein (PEBP) family uncharacterized protein
MMKFRSSLVLVSALALASACSSSPSKGGGGDTGGEGGDATGGSGTGGKATGGTTGSTGGSTGSTGGSTGSTGGSTGSTGGSTGSTGGSTGSTGGSGGNTGGSGGGAADAGTDGPPASGGKLTITVDGVPDPAKMRFCFKPSATNSGGDHSPKIDWTGVPPEAKSLILTTEDLTGTPVCHQIICNIPTTVTGNPADAKGMIPAGAEASYGHSGKTAWYGPGADMRNYEIKIWALATPMFAGGCGGPATSSRMHCARLKMMANDKSVVLATASQVLWGQKSGTGCP